MISTCFRTVVFPSGRRSTDFRLTESGNILSSNERNVLPEPLAIEINQPGAMVSILLLLSAKVTLSPVQRLPDVTRRAMQSSGG
jgi:hypothetical protein